MLFMRTLVLCARSRKRDDDVLRSCPYMEQRDDVLVGRLLRMQDIRKILISHRRLEICIPLCSSESADFRSRHI